MKLIRSVVDPEKLDHIKAELAKLCVLGITLTTVLDHVPQKERTLVVWRARRFTSRY